MLSLSESAVRAVQRFIRGAETPALGLRVSVSGGGCSGLQYGLSLVEAIDPDDQVIEFGPVVICVDPSSAPLLKDVKIDFIDSVDGSGFKFDNPNATQSCGCGNSFSA